MPTTQTIIVFVHGWSVTNTDTYGNLPQRLRNEATNYGINIKIEEIFLSKYISFHDEVTIDDISLAFRSALKDQLDPYIDNGQKFICITHSTGGPVIRNWWQKYYKSQNTTCPMSHLIMLAPANFGSALAQLGKGRISRIKSWLDGVEPGQGVLNWLELGSIESWEMNLEWIFSKDLKTGDDNVYPFVLTGDYIDRKLYDNLNNYTGELGSDGVVRTSAANLNSNYVKLVQQDVELDAKGKFSAHNLNAETIQYSQNTAMRIISFKSHSGNTMGIMKSVKSDFSDKNSHELIDAIFRSAKVDSLESYAKIIHDFEIETENIQNIERLETKKFDGLPARNFIHDKYTMVIFRVTDTDGRAVNDFDILLTAGTKSDPNHLPQGFFVDRQRNSISGNMITYYINYSIMNGCVEVKNEKNEIIRDAQPGISTLGFKIIARPDDGFVHYLPCELKADKEIMKHVITPNSTTMVEIVLQRVVHRNVFRLSKMDENYKAEDFKKVKPF